MFKIHRLIILLIASLLTACESTPSGPSWMALPGSGKSFNEFRKDDYQCRQFAHEQTSGTYFEDYSEFVNQQRYDTSYVQCMYTKDHRVPVRGQIPDGSTESGSNNQSESVPPPPSGQPLP